MLDLTAEVREITWSDSHTNLTHAHPAARYCFRRATRLILLATDWLWGG
jgi:hypothetical protein